MIVAITPRQWTGLIDALDIGAPVAALEQALGVSFINEGARFVHRELLFRVVEEAVARHGASTLTHIFDARGVCWAHYRTLTDALSEEPRLFSDNPVFAPIRHQSGTYPTPGAMARLPQDERLPARPAPRIGEDTDEVLTVLLGMSSGEVARLMDAGIVA